MSEIESPTADRPRFTRGHHRGHRPITQIWFNIGGGNVEPMRSLRATPSRSRLTGISGMLKTRPFRPPYPLSAANRLLRSTNSPQQPIPPLLALRDASAAKVDHTKSCVRARRVRADKRRCLADSDARTRFVRNSWRVSNGRCSIL